MKKIFSKIGFIAAIAILLSACADSYDDRKKAPVVPDNSMGVYFTMNNTGKYDLGPSDLASTVMNVEIARVKTDAAATVPLKVTQTDNFFSCPESVSFAAGQSTANIEVKINGSGMGRHLLRIDIDDLNYANPYLEVDGTTLFTIDVEVWKTLGKGDFYYNYVWGGIDQGVDLFYSENSEQYRFSDWGGGVDILFTIEADNTIIIPQQLIGYNHPTYGPMYVVDTDGYSYYDPATKTYYFNWEYIVSAGTFGEINEKFVLTDPA